MTENNYVENRSIAAAQNIKERNYWLEKLSGELGKCTFPIDFKRNGTKKDNMENYQFMFPTRCSEMLLKLSNNSDIRLHIIFLTGLFVLLHKYNYESSNDIIVGIPIYKQDREGDFINTAIAIRTQTDDKITFKELLVKVALLVREASDHQNYPIETLFPQLKLEFGEEDYPLFNIALLLENIHNPGYLDHIPTDITFLCTRHENSIKTIISYNALRYEQKTIVRICDYFAAVLQVAAENLEVTLGQLEWISEAQKVDILNSFNEKEVTYPRDKTILDLFDIQVAKNPDTKAVVFKDDFLTYKELNTKANGVALRLQNLGVAPEIIVGIVLEPSLDMIVAIFGIIKAGGAYMPIDPEYPENRIAFMLKDSNTGVLLTSKNISLPVQFNGTRVFLDDIEQSGDSVEYLSNRCEPANILYIIYTSGTTGKPKGVMIQHYNLLRLMVNDKNLFDFDQHDVWTMFHSYCFDFSVWEMYGALLFGGELIIIPKMIARDPVRFLEILQEHKVTVLNQTPSAFYNLIHEEIRQKGEVLPLRYVIFGGEALSPIKLKDWRSRYPHVKLINMFGITETTVHVTYKEVSDSDIMDNISNIGKPIPTLVTYILDSHLKLLPEGIPGQLYVGGDGVARGYLNRPELTAERFINNPFQPNERLYASGDLAKNIGNSDMVYIGRMDQQIQLRGFRIELKEIENQLLHHNEIKDAVVIAETDAEGDTYLIAYIIAETEIAVSDLREYLSRSLPFYMIPKYFVYLERMPLTSNGKLDKSALPKPDLTIKEKSIPPRTVMEHRLAKLWQDVLGVDNIGINDNYFNIGGDSIKAVKLLGLINNELKSNLRIPDLYENETIEKLACYMDTQEKSEMQEQVQAVFNELAELKQRIMVENDIPDDVEDIYPMSDIEQGMIFTSLANPDKAIYYDQFVFPMKFPDFDISLFNKSLTLMVEKHSMLRTSYHIGIYEDDVRFVHRPYPASIRDIDLLGKSKKEQEEIINKFMGDSRLSPFDVTQPRLWKMTVFRLNEEGNVIIVWEFHHAILDGWSNASLMTELNHTYLRLKTEPSFQPEPLKNSYKAYIAEQIAEKRNTENLNFWRQQLTDYKRLDFAQQLGIRDKSEGNKKYLVRMGAPLLEKLKEWAQLHNTSVKHICFAAYLKMLNMISFENDMVVGMVTTNRPVCEDGEKVLGCFLNSVPVRVSFPVQASWLDFVQFVEGKIQQIKKYDRLSLFQITRLMGENTEGKNPFFDTFFNYVDFHVYESVDQNSISYNKKEEEGNKLRIEGHEVTNTLLDLTVNTTSGNFDLLMNFRIAVFSYELIEQMAGYFTEFFNKLLEEPHAKLAKLALMPEDQKEKILITFNDSDRDFPVQKLIHQLLDEQVQRTPENIALLGADCTNPLTYQQVNEKADQIAGYLHEKGVRVGDIVAIMVERSLFMVTGILGILKAGAAYMPIIPNHPIERIKYMIKDSQVHLLLGCGKFHEVDGLCEYVNLEEIPLMAPKITSSAVLMDVTDMSYVLYTSGSTGTPKGVAAEHRGVVNILWALQESYPLLVNDVYLLKTSYIFDVSVSELFGWFMGGGRLVILEPGGERDPQIILNTIETHHVTHMNFVPSMFNLFVNLLNDSNKTQLASLKYIFLAGEAIIPEFVSKFRKINAFVSIENIYGPTEATVYGSQYSLINWNGQGSVSIGKPVNNTRLYILDKLNHLQPIGVAGELHIAGVGLTRGYLNNPELTCDRFVDNPFAESAGNPARFAKLYKTGDLTRWSNDGNIEFLGRIDHQVKVRGFRIELGEIESALLKNEHIKEAIVVQKQQMNTEKFLCAYIVADGEMNIPDLRVELASHIPTYMVPSYFMQLVKMPLNPSGKIDLKALPEPAAGDSGEQYVEARDDVEEVLVKVFSKVLGVKKIGINDNFFVLGGDSIKAVQISAKLLQEGLKLEINDLFKNPTISQLRNYIKQTKKRVEQGVVEGPVKLPPIAKWFFEHIKTDRHHWNHALMVFRAQGFSEELIKRVFTRIIEHHDALRLVVSVHNEEIALYNQGVAETSLDLHVFHLTDLAEPELSKTITEKANSLQASFDLNQGPLVKLGLFKTASGDHLLMVFHHLVIDGVSWRILFEDFEIAYRQAEKGENIALPPKSTSYKEWVEKIYQYATSQQLQKELDYWKKLDAHKVVTVPRDNQIQVDKVKDSHHIEIILTETETEELLKKVPQAYNTEINDILLTALGLAVKEWLNGDHVLVEMEGHGREEVLEDLDITRTFGWFASVYPVVLNMSSSHDLGNIIKNTKESLRAIPHKGVGGSILKYIAAPAVRQQYFHLQPEIFFNYMGQIDFEQHSELFEISPISSGSTFGPQCERLYPLYVNGMVVNNKLMISLEYNRLAFNETTMTTFLERYKQHLLRIIKHCVACQGSEMTASDFSSPDFDASEVDDMFEVLGEVLGQE